MDGFDQINELVTLVQKYRNFEAFLGGEPYNTVTPQDVLTIMNEHPGELQDMIDLARDRPQQLGMTDSETSSFTEGYVDELLQEWRFLPSDINLMEQDYNEVSDYFRGRKLKSQLSEANQDLIESLTYKADDFAVDSGLFDFDHDAVLAYNRREQLIGMLERDNILNRSMIESFETEFPEQFSTRVT